MILRQAGWDQRGVDIINGAKIQIGFVNDQFYIIFLALKTGNHVINHLNTQRLPGCLV